MKGIQFVVDESGKKKAVVIDLAEWGELWEDFYDVLVSDGLVKSKLSPPQVGGD